MSMMSGTTFVFALAASVSSILAGCLGGGSNEGDASSTPSETLWAPAEAYNETVPLDLTRAAAAPPVLIQANWRSLTLRVWATTTAACGAVQRNPDSGAEPNVRFTSPSGTGFTFSLPAGTQCTKIGDRFGGGTNTAPPERGTWTMLIDARGEGVDVHMVVTGS